MNIIIAIANWIFVLCLPVLLLTASIAGAVNSAWLYRYGFSKYEVTLTTGLTETELDKAADGLVSYFNSNEELISLTVIKDGEPFALFNEREIAHLKDVKGLIWLDYWALLGTLVYVLGYAGVCILWQRQRYWPQLARAVVYGSGLTLALILALGLGIWLDFDRLFWQFHVISFTNELWQLDPARDYLIMLFPQGFWYDATTFCALAIASGAVVLGATGSIYLKRHNGNKKRAA